MGNQAGRQIGEVIESTGDATVNVIQAKTEATIWENICTQLPVGCLILRLLGILAVIGIIGLIAYAISTSNSKKKDE